MRNLSDLFVKFFPVCFYDNDQGAAGGAESPAPEGGAGGDPGADSLVDDIPAEAIANDPELKEIIESGKKSEKVADKKTDSEGVEDKADAEGDADKKAGEPEANAGETDDLSAIEFEDDVIPGLKGEHLKTMPKEALAALADFQGTHAELSTKAQKTEENLTKLLADPIVKRRMELLKSGKTDYEVRGLNATERQSILKAIAEAGDLSPAEAENVFGVLEKSLDTVVREAATDTLQGLIQEDSRQRQIEETQKTGRQAFLELGKFNKSLAFKETDASKFWTDEGALNDKHPEAKQFKEKILPLMTALHEAGQTYESIARLSKKSGGQAVYALVAALQGLPVALNTAERDKKIVASELKKKLAPFLKKNSVSGLDTKGSSVIPADRALNAAVVKNGYDVLKLAEGGEYYDKAVQAKGADPDHIALIDSLAAEGLELAAKRQKVKQ
ncbi:MAG: hypothetical protein EHM66_00395 [Deltaproteobacteria bacterium]|nr:MAG: hypothetical protein EHM66_00395 [Deltaproteobacteria bacterium]